MTATRIAVVGGGLAGLTAAAVAARAGADVKLFERAGETGGRAQTAERDGVLLNIGPHALYRGRAAMRVFKELGMQWSGHRPAAGGLALANGRRYRLPATAGGVLITGALSARGKAELARLFAGLKGIDTRSLDTVTLRDWIEGTLHDRGARRAVEALARVSTYSNSPEIVSAGAVIDQLRGAGVEYLDGGWATLVRELERVATQQGVRIERGAAVEAVTYSTPAWTVTERGGSEPFDTVILALDPKTAARLAGGEALETWAAEAVPVKAAVLDVVLDRLPNAKGRFALGLDRPTYLSIHSLTAKLAPEGKHLVTTAWYRSGEGDPSDEAIEQALEASLDLVQPGWRESVAYRRYLPDLVVTNDHTRAATAGTTARPGPEVPGRPGLFVAGDWAGSEGMLADSAVASGEKAGLLAARISRSEAAHARVDAA